MLPLDTRPLILFHHNSKRLEPQAKARFATASGNER